MTQRRLVADGERPLAHLLVACSVLLLSWSLFPASARAAIYYGATPEEAAADSAPLPDYAQWRAQALTAPVEPPVLVDEYATQELGHPWDFSNGDPGGLHYDGGITNVRYADGELSFDVTAPGRIWYGYAGAGRNRAEELDLGETWPRLEYYPVLQMQVKQSLPQSDWTFTTIDGRTSPAPDIGHAPLKVQGTDWQTVAVTGEQPIMHATFTCLMLEAATPGNHVEVKWFKAGRNEQRGYLRTVLDLPAAPRQALLNLNGSEYELYVNGKQAYSYHYYMGAGLVRPVDCTSLLHAGKNTLTVILFKPGLALQGQVLLADGRAIKVQTDQTWKASATAPAGWMDAGFDDSSWSKPQVTGAPSVPAPYDGSIALIAQPAHPSAPSVPELSSAVPPIFDFAEGARFAVRLPTQKLAPQTEYHVRYAFADPWTHAEVAPGEVTDFHADGPDQVTRLDTKLAKPGAYDLTLQWVSGGQVLDTRHEEVMLIGPVAQTRVPEDQVEATMKLKLVDEIDCTDPADTHPRLTTNGGWGQSYTTFPVQVTTSPAGKYLESQTTAAGDCVRYVVNLPHPYAWHLVEFEYPDDADRIMVFGYEDRIWTAGHAENWQRGDSGPHTGWGLPTTGHMQTWRLPVLPGKPQGSLYIANCKDGNKLGIARIRVYEVTGELPGVTTAHEEPGRNFGVHEERPLEIYSFAAFPGWDKWVHGQCYTAAVGNYARWYRTYENYIRYLRYAGHNYAQMDLYMYGDYSQPAWPSPNKGNDWYNPRFDYITPMLRLFDANGINCMLTFEYASDFNLHGWGSTDFTDEEVAAGAPTNVLVDKNGHQLNWYFGSQRDPLQPEVQRSMFANLDDLLGRYARYKSVKAVSFLEGSPYDPAFPIEIGAPGDWLSSGYGEYDIALFTKDTGIQVPGSPKDPQRFAQRYAWLKAHAYEPWLTWRCQQVKQINDRLLQHVQAARPGLLFVPMIGEWNHAPYMELAHRLSGESYHQLLRESGRDPQLYVGQPGYVSYGELYPPDRARTAGMHQQNREDFGAGRSMGLSSELPQLFGSGPGTGLFDFECFYEQGLFLPPDIDWIFKGGTFSAAAYSLGSRDFVRDRLVTSLWHWDPSYLVMAWCDGYQLMGNEENLRPFALAFRSLPVGKYTLLSTNGADRNVAIKQLQGRPVWAILNPSPWPITVELSLSPGASLQDRVTGHSLPAQAGTATVELRACDLVVVEGTPGAALTGVKVTTSPEALSYLQARVADYHQLLAMAQRQSAAVAAADLAGMTAAAAKLDAALQSGDLLTAWLVLESWEGRRPYVDCRNAISPSNWRVIGPFPLLSAQPLQPDYGPEADLLAGKPPAATYSTNSGRALSWTRLQVPAQDPQAIHFYTLYGESPNSVAYAFAHVSSPVAQKVRFLLGSDDGVKVWLNGQVLEENEIARGLHLGDDVFEGNLRAGDNTLLLRRWSNMWAAGTWPSAWRRPTASR